MARACKVCAHPEREAIEAAILGGQPHEALGRAHGMSGMAVTRHAATHLLDTLAKAHQAAEVARADDLLSQVQDLQARTLGILGTAEGNGNLALALAAIREARGNVELLGRLMNRLQNGAVVNIIVNPQWVQIRAVLMDALAPYPDARQRVASALEALNAGE